MMYQSYQIPMIYKQGVVLSLILILTANVGVLVNNFLKIKIPYVYYYYYYYYKNYYKMNKNKNRYVSEIDTIKAQDEEIILLQDHRNV